MNSDISKGKLLTWMRNASEATAAGRDRSSDEIARSRMEGEVRIMVLLTEKIIEGQFNVGND